MLNSIHDLKNAPYTFSTEQGTFDDRFILRFTNSTLSVNPIALQDVVVIKNQSTIEVLASSNMILDKVNLFDMRGRLIASNENINSNTTQFANLAIANQVLLVQIFDEYGNSVTKKLIF